MTSKIKVDNINKVSDDSNIINKCGTTITLGASGDSITLASGASQTGFGREGSVDWQTGSIKTTTFTAASGEGYFVDTSSGAVTANLPAGTAGAIVAFADYTRTFGTNKLTIVPNGSNKIGGVNNDAELKVDGQAATFVFVDATEGWINVQNAEDTETGKTFVTATGGTISTVCTNFKVHTFTGPGTFCVSQISDVPANNEIDYLVVAGGGGGGSTIGGGGGGGGGFRYSSGTYTSPSCAPGHPLTAACGVTLTATGGFPITVGAGGAPGIPGPSTSGGNSIAALPTPITSAGGGTQNTAGGSGGGGSHRSNNTYAGNTPPVSPPQGNPGGQSPLPEGFAGSGGGGAISTGGNCAIPSVSGGTGGNGGDGAGLSAFFGTSGVPCGSFYYFSGGAGGGGYGGGPAPTKAGGTGGKGGGGVGGEANTGNSPSQGTPGGTGTANSGGGGGGEGHPSGGTPNVANPAAGGSGIVIIRYKFQ